MVTLSYILIGLIVSILCMLLISLFEESILGLMCLGALGFVCYLVGKLITIRVTGKG